MESRLIRILCPISTLYRTVGFSIRCSLASDRAWAYLWACRHILMGIIIQPEPTFLWQLSFCTNHFLVPLDFWYEQIIRPSNLIVLVVSSMSFFVPTVHLWQPFPNIMIYFSVPANFLDQLLLRNPLAKYLQLAHTRVHIFTWSQIVHHHYNAALLSN